MGFRNLPATTLRIDGRPSALRIYEARRFFARARGLLGQDRLHQDEGLWISPCGSVHTVGMRYAIDVLFLNRQQQVVAVKSALGPLRFAAHGHAHSTLELAAGAALAAHILPGSLLERLPL